MFTYSFRTTVEHLEFGRLTYCVAYVPQALAQSLPLADYPRLRVRGAINEQPLRAALLPDGNGRHYLLLSRRLLRQCGAERGSSVTVGFEIDDQDAVEVPQELQRVLEYDHSIAARWQALTPGKRRGYAYRIASAKRPATRERRVAEVLEEL